MVLARVYHAFVKKLFPQSTQNSAAEATEPCSLSCSVKLRDASVTSVAKTLVKLRVNYPGLVRPRRLVPSEEGLSAPNGSRDLQ